MKKLTQEKLNEMLDQHELWRENRNIGKRLDISYCDVSGLDFSNRNMRGSNMSGAYMRGVNMSGANMRGLNMSGADMRGAYMSDANMSDANMSGANMRGADMSDANMSGANMRGSNIDYVSLFDATGNSVNIITIQLGKYTVNYTHDRMQIGCKNYPIKEWFNFSDEKIESMDNRALDWWNKYKYFIKQAIELTPALKTR